ncbi:MAG: hypothetical protein OEX19_02575 [Gammaproteobacteria bacterium]|nr:hypothetical protein [Gammaproteobacteria bacterium]
MTDGEYDIFPLRIMSKTIDAVCYNHARLALLRIGKPLRIELQDHRGLVIILDNDSWLCVDSVSDDQPIMMWCEFDTSRHNTALNEDVPCLLHLYHNQAGLIMGSALDALNLSLSEILLALKSQPSS